MYNAKTAFAIGATMADMSETGDGETTQVRQTLYWGLATAIAGVVLWRFGDPWLMEHFGSGAPWWAYLLLSLRLVGGVAQMVIDDAALCRQARAPDARHTRHSQQQPAQRATGAPWPAGGFPSSEEAAQEMQATSGPALR